MRYVLIGLVLIIMINCEDFSQTWFDGRAEVSTYDLKEKHYDQWRKGHRILIFVTEAIMPGSFIKSDIPQKNVVNVMKMNDIRRFTTGIYEYSVMSSVFMCLWSNVALRHSFTSQEWCGTVFEEWIRRGNRFEAQINSYFESPGRKEISLPVKKNIDLEENLWILVRELSRKLPLDHNNEMRMKVVPASWRRMKTKIDVRPLFCVLRKEGNERVSISDKEYHSVKFSWTIGNETTSVWVEDKLTRRILKWESPYSQGILRASQRNAYWQKNALRDQTIRQNFRLPTAILTK